MQICGKCRRQIPNWANGICSCSILTLICRVCGTTISGGTSTGCPWCGSYNLTSVGSNNPNQNKHPSFTPDALRLRLDSFNQLLLDIYDEPITLGQLLIRQGVPETRIRSWRQDRRWLGQFLDHLQLRLRADLDESVLNYSPQILTYWYGLSNGNALPVSVIAYKLGVPPAYVENGLKALLTYMRSNSGQLSFEQGILAASKR